MSKSGIREINPAMSELIDRYGHTAAWIGLNQVRTARLNGFVAQYMADDSEPIRVGSNEYTHRRVGMITLGGLMVHARLHDRPHTIDEDQQYLIVVDSYASTDPVEYWTASSKEPEYGVIGQQQTVVTANTLVEHWPTLKSVDEQDDTVDEQKEDWEIALDHELARAALPQMSWGDKGWFVRVGPEAYDQGHDALAMQRMVRKLRQDPAFVSADRTAREVIRLPPTGSDT